MQPWTTEIKLMTPVTGVTFKPKCAVPLFCWIITLTVNASMGLVWYSVYLFVDLIYLFIYLLLGKLSESTSLQPAHNFFLSAIALDWITIIALCSVLPSVWYTVNTQVGINWAGGCFFFLQRGGISILTWKKLELFMTCFSLRDGACNYKITYVATMKGPTAAGGYSPSVFSFSSFPAFIWI